MKKTIRNLIPNELADVAVDLAPFVAPFNAPLAAAMRGIGRFDQRGSISDALKQAAATYGGGKLVGMIPGTGNYFGQGLEGAKALGSDAMSGITSIFKGGGKNAANEILKGSPKGMPDFSGMGTGGGAVKTSSGGIMDTIKNFGGKVIDSGQEYLLGKDKKFQMGDIGRFLGDPSKTIPLTMIATYIKEKFFPDEDQDSFDAKFAEAMAKRGENVASYLKRSGPFDPRRDPTKNPYSQDEIDQFADDLTIEYRNVAADGGIMTVPRENYFLGSLKDKLKRSAKPLVRTVEAQPRSPGAARDVTPDDILNVFKEKFDEGVFFKGRLLPKSVSSTFTANPEMPLPVGTTRRSLENIGKIPKASKVSSDDILNVFKEKFDGGNFFGRGSSLLPKKVSATFTPQQALPAERASDEEVGSTIKEFFENRLRGMPASFRPEIMENEEIMELLGEGDQKGLDALMTSLLRNANFDRFRAARGGDTPEENAMQAAGIEGLDLNINPKGITELDMRETGGFIPPVGVKEKEDDIPAMLSNNEFVFTADAVRGMGDGDVDKGAERMYSMMKRLENGGRV